MNKNIIYLILTIIGGLMLMGTTLFTIINWTQMPDQIPLHFDFSGNVTNYGGKAAIIPILAITWVIFVLMTVIVKFPKTCNIPVAITKENERKFIHCSTLRGQRHPWPLILIQS